MIDVHIHAVPPRLPGVGSLSPLLDMSTELVAAALREQMQAAGVTQVLAMGCWNISAEDPLGVADTLRLGRHVPELHAIGVADPTRNDAEHLRRVAAALTTGQVRALKGYLGYLHFGPADPPYVPYYELAARHNIPFIFHTGDTYSPRAKLRFAQPLLVDDVAVDHPDVRFVLAHVGNPWMIDAAEVVYKNVNVWADLSGLLVGDDSVFTGEEKQQARADAIRNIAQAFHYAERPNRFLYGSDWPLAPMPAYRDFIQAAIPPVYHPLVFEDNARTLFRL
jgi:predicted TIM-barrel fold metal-dependent hydrolase